MNLQAQEQRKGGDNDEDLRGVRKAPSLAWADLGNGFRPFLVGDMSVSNVHIGT